jgi:hypothetical protein
MSSPNAPAAREPDRDLLKVAHDAAVAGNFYSMMEALVSSRLLEGFYRYMQWKWPKYQPDDVATLIGQAIDAFYLHAKAGRRIGNASGYIFKTLQKFAVDENVRRERENEFVTAEAELVLYQAHQGKNYRNSVPREDLVKEALRIARNLLPSIGEITLQQVGEFYLDAVAKGIMHLDDHALADAINKDLETAKRLRRRFLERLTSRARDAGIRLEAIFGPDTFQLEEDSNGAAE